jgi:hypothetical protein
MLLLFCCHPIANKHLGQFPARLGEFMGQAGAIRAYKISLSLAGLSDGA